MLEITHLQLTDKKQAHLLYDVSFSLPSIGLTSICGDSKTLNLYIAQVLAGFRKPDKGTLKYNDIEITEFQEVEQSLYRSSFTASLFSDFQILEKKCVLDNIKMGLSNEENIDALLKGWGLFKKAHMKIGELPFLDQMKAVFIRILLRNPSVLVIYPDSSPYSPKEWLQLYPYLKRMSKQLAIIVVGDERCYAYSDRILEIRDGHVISDTTKNVPAEFYYIKKHTNFRMDSNVRYNINKRLNHRFRWKYRVLTILILIGFVCVSASIFSTTLNIADIEMMYLEQNNYSTIAIAKYVEGKDGTIYNKSFSTLKEKDIKNLQEHMNGKFVESYSPQNMQLFSNQAINAYEDDLFRNYSLIETKNLKELGASLVGDYPRNDNEVVLNYDDAQAYFKNTIVDEDGSGKVYLGQQIYWFHIPLTITGIIHIDNIQNLALYSNENQLNLESNGLRYGSLYVNDGFHKSLVMSKQQIFKQSNKQIINILNSVSYSVTNFYPIEYSTFYSDGKTQYINLDKPEQPMKDNEVILSFSMALKMGFLGTYQTEQFQHNMSLEDKKQSYEDFTRKWIGKTIRVQAYESESAPTNTMIFEENMRIKGFLYPLTWDYDESYLYDVSSLYMNRNVIKPYLEPNYMIKELYFHTNDKGDMKNALQYLLDQNLYTAYLSKPVLMQFFVIDLKELSVILAIGGSIALILSVVMLLRILKEACSYLKKEISVYYMFGEQKKYIKRMYVQYFIDVLSKRISIGWILSTLVIAAYVLVIFFKIVMHTAILYNLLLPLGLGILFLICIVAALFIALRKEKLVDEEFTRDM